MSTIGFIVLMVIQISLLIDIYISSSTLQLIDEREHEKRMLEIDKQTEQEKEKN